MPPPGPAAILAALLLIPAASAGHGFYLSDHGTSPGPGNINYLEWETDGETTRVGFSGNLGDSPRHVVVLAGKAEGPVQRHVRTAADHNGSLLLLEGDGAEAEWTHGSDLTVHWRPPLEPKTCVLVVAWVGDGANGGHVEDVVPNTALESLDDPAALWDRGRACSERSRLNYAAECGHPDIPAYCSPGPAWPAVALLLAAAALVHGRTRADRP